MRITNHIPARTYQPVDRTLLVVSPAEGSHELPVIWPAKSIDSTIRHCVLCTPLRKPRPGPDQIIINRNHSTALPHIAPVVRDKRNYLLFIKQCNIRSQQFIPTILEVLQQKPGRDTIARQKNTAAFALTSGFNIRSSNGTSASSNSYAGKTRIRKKGRN